MHLIMHLPIIRLRTSPIPMGRMPRHLSNGISALVLFAHQTWEARLLAKREPSILL